MTARVIPFRRHVHPSPPASDTRPLPEGKRRRFAGKAYQIQQHPGAIAVVTPGVEWWLSVEETREFARELLRLADYAEAER